MEETRKWNYYCFYLGAETTIWQKASLINNKILKDKKGIPSGIPSTYR